MGGRGRKSLTVLSTGRLYRFSVRGWGQGHVKFISNPQNRLDIWRPSAYVDDDAKSD